MAALALRGLAAASEIARRAPAGPEGSAGGRLATENAKTPE
jgi:hypothetical protein